MVSKIAEKAGSTAEAFVSKVDDVAEVAAEEADDVARAAEKVAGEVAKEKKLLPGEGEVGTYDDLIKAGKRGDNITPHHMPSAEYMSKKGVSKGDGLCMNMEMPTPGCGGRHRMTSTYGGNMSAVEKAAYYSLSPRDALAFDLNSIKSIYQGQGLYSEI